MKYYKDASDTVFAYESDGSQDAFIPGDQTLIEEEEADTLRTPAAADMIEAAKTRIHADFEAFYRAQIEDYTGQPYSQAEITSWPMQEAEGWDYIQNGEAAITQWLDAFSIVSGTTKNELALVTTQRVGWYKAMYIGATAMRFNALEAIDALGAEPTQEQLDAILFE